jgi:ArsR family transcriptional regulator
MGNAPRSKAGKDKTLPEEVAQAIQEIGGLDNLSSNMPSAEELDREVAIHHALSDRKRLTILWALRCCDLCPCVLKEYLNISDSKLSYHLGTLENAGLVNSYPRKNWKIYSISELGRDTLHRGCMPEWKGDGQSI